MTEVTRGVFLGHAPCPHCGSSDGLALYDNGTNHCFVCQTSGRDGTGKTTTSTRKAPPGLIQGDFQALKARGITLETCRKFGYQVGTHRGAVVHIAPYYRAGELVAQHLRTADKKFSWTGTMDKCELFGQHLWTPSKYIVVTEGEIDAMSVAQAFGLKWGAVSIPNGAASAFKYIGQNIEWLMQFDSVILWFDNDTPGKEGMEKCITLFPAGKLKIVNSGEHKDANDMLRNAGPDAVLKAVYGAQEKRPDGVYSADQLHDRMLSYYDQPILGDPLPYEELSQMLGNLRPGRIYTFTAGSGIGKTTFVSEIAYHLKQVLGKTVGYIALEEPPEETMLRMMGIHCNRRLYVDPKQLTREEYEKAFKEVTDRLFLYDHFGSQEAGTLLSKMNYLAVGCGCQYIVFDHLSIAVSGSGADITDSERIAIDHIMTDMRELTQRTGATVLAICHLRKKEGGTASHEEGGRVRASELRGSGSIFQISDGIIALERNTQDAEDPNVSTIRILKNRVIGKAGVAGKVRFNEVTGRMLTETVDSVGNLF